MEAALRRLHFEYKIDIKTLDVFVDDDPKS
jgi:hypothetical protein